MASIIVLEHKENGKWVKVTEIIDNRKDSFMGAFKYINGFLGLHVLDSRHTRKDGKRVHYYKSEATIGGFDFRARFI